LFASRRRHTSCYRDWSSDVCSSDLRLSPLPIAASRSITCTFGKRANRRTHRNTSSSLRARRSPCTSCTTAPPLRSIEGISIFRSDGSSLPLLLFEVRRSQRVDQPRINEPGGIALIVEVASRAEFVDRGNRFLVVLRVVAR